MSLSANGSSAEFVRDVSAVDETMNNIEEFDLTTLGGPDQVAINDLTGTSITKVHVDLAGSDGMGDQQPDTVTVNGTDEADNIGVLESGADVAVKGLSAVTDVSGGESTDQLHISGLGGNDSVSLAQTATTPIDVHVGLGASYVCPRSGHDVLAKVKSGKLRIGVVQSLLCVWPVPVIAPCSTGLSHEIRRNRPMARCGTTDREDNVSGVSPSVPTRRRPQGRSLVWGAAL
jgi:hypothetical protein